MPSALFWFDLSFTTILPILHSFFCLFISSHVSYLRAACVSLLVTWAYQSQAPVQDLILAVSAPRRGGCGLSLAGWERWLGAGAWSQGVIFRKCWRHRNMQGRRRHAGPPLTQGETYRKQHVGWRRHGNKLIFLLVLFYFLGCKTLIAVILALNVHENMSYIPKRMGVNLFAR